MKAAHRGVDVLVLKTHLSGLVLSNALKQSGLACIPKATIIRLFIVVVAHHSVLALPSQIELLLVKLGVSFREGAA